jgi:putative endonuclease
VTNRPNGTLYTGVTSNMPRRAFEHRNGLINGFSKRYGLKRLVWYEFHDDIRSAIQRERNMKHWPRAWKVRLILFVNPEYVRHVDLIHFAGRPCCALAFPRLAAHSERKAWMAGSSPAMTWRGHGVTQSVRQSERMVQIRREPL